MDVAVLDISEALVHCEEVAPADDELAAGGEPAYGYQILARLTVQPFPTVRRRTPDYRPGFGLLGLTDSAASWYALPIDTVAPRSDRPAYTGPIAVLSSAATSGAAEDFLAAFRNTARGVIIGATSAGSPGRPLTRRAGSTA